MRVFLISFLLLEISLGNINFLREIDELDWKVPSSYTGTFRIDPKAQIAVSNENGQLLIETSDSAVLFTGKSLTASAPLVSKGITIIPVYEKVGGGLKFYSLLMCKNSPKGVMGRLLMLNLTEQDRKAPLGLYYIIGLNGRFDYPNVGINVALADGKNGGSSIWEAEIDIGPSPDPKFLVK